MLIIIVLNVQSIANGAKSFASKTSQGACRILIEQLLHIVDHKEITKLEIFQLLY